MVRVRVRCFNVVEAELKAAADEALRVRLSFAMAWHCLACLPGVV